MHLTVEKFDSSQNAQESGILESEFENLRHLPQGQGLLEARLRGRSVVIKSFGSIANLERELAWGKTLNRLGLGAKYLGKTQVRGKASLVIEKAEGSNTQKPMLADDAVFITAKVAAEMKRQAQVLFDAGIWPLDLQFLISRSEKVTLIDPALFERNDGSHSQKDLDEMLERIFFLWGMEDRMID